MNEIKAIGNNKLVILLLPIA